jgi:hypothetical protein
MRRILVLLPAVAALAGCAAQGGPAGGFRGEQKAVAQTVSDLGEAGRRKNPQKICTNLLARSLVAKLKTAQGDCVEEMTRATDDADDFTFRVRSVQVRGAQATAVVEQGKHDARHTFSFAREGGRWRATSFGR